MRRVLLACIVAALAGVSLSAQTTVATRRSVLWWVQDAADLATANSYTYRYYVDADSTAYPLPGATCANQSPPSTGHYDCSAPLPNIFSYGDHTIAVTATLGVDESGHSSPALSFTYSQIQRVIIR